MNGIVIEFREISLLLPNKKAKGVEQMDQLKNLKYKNID